MQGIDRQLGRVALGPTEAAELRFNLAHAHACGVQQPCAADQGDHGAARRHRRSATARIEARGRDPSLAVARLERQRDPDQIAARRATRGSRERLGRHTTPPQRPFQMLGEALPGALLDRAQHRHPSLGRPDGARAQLPSSSIACSIANASVRPVITSALPVFLISISVGVWSICTSRVIVPNEPT